MPTAIHDAANASRKKHTDAVLSSSAKKKVVVAGPGTGKTHLFKEVLKGKGNTLTLTFINALVDDLSLELCGLSDVRTLHSFARSELARCTGRDIKIFPGLTDAIKEDIFILQGKTVDFDTIFQTRNDKSLLIDFYRKRKDYYGSYYGLTDVIYAITRYYEANPKKIPAYEQIVVDEFQDFNQLEVSLLERLAAKSPILLAGDDDQALYDFKKANAGFVRDRHSGATPGYAAFTLPFCSRSTEVVVAAANDLVSKAVSNGLLVGRIAKRYDYFPDPSKDQESAKYPKLDYHQQFATKIPWLITRELATIANAEKKTFSVLVISPNKVQIRDVVGSLRKKGLRNISFEEKKTGGKGALSFANGLRLLLEDRDCNLGWRICVKCILDDTAFATLLEESGKIGAMPFVRLVDEECRKTIKATLMTARAIIDDKAVSNERLTDILELLDIDSFAMSRIALKESLITRSSGVMPALKRIPITATTVQSSKGLAADYVFITHFDDKYLLSDKTTGKPSDRDVCSFLVALTRARKKVFLISTSTSKRPIFLDWIDASRVNCF